MPYVPGTPGAPSQTSPVLNQQQPSADNILMAAADMHAMGKFDQPSALPATMTPKSVSKRRGPRGR